MPGRLTYDQLPTKLRKKIAAGETSIQSPGRNRTASRVSGKSPGWRCAKCGETFSVWAKAERHYHPSPTVPDSLAGVIEVVW